MRTADWKTLDGSTEQDIPQFQVSWIGAGDGRTWERRGSFTVTGEDDGELNNDRIAQYLSKKKSAKPAKKTSAPKAVASEKAKLAEMVGGAVEQSNAGDIAQLQRDKKKLEGKLKEVDDKHKKAIAALIAKHKTKTNGLEKKVETLNKKVERLNGRNKELQAEVRAAAVENTKRLEEREASAGPKTNKPARTRAPKKQARQIEQGADSDTQGLPHPTPP
jgi:outer membrane murein-binding lipoprotein Lpp